MNTNKHKSKNSESIIELFRKDYLSKNAKNLANKTGEIVQGHISRGSHSSSVCLNEQLGTHYDYIDSLIDYIIESLKNDFPNIPLGQCRDRLLAIIDEEYRKLIPFASSFLVSTGLALQSNLKGFEKGVDRKKQEVKQGIETKIVIIEEQRLAAAETVKKKPWYKRAWPYITAIAVILAIIWYVVDLKERFFPGK